MFKNFGWVLLLGASLISVACSNEPTQSSEPCEIGVGVGLDSVRRAECIIDYPDGRRDTISLDSTSWNFAAERNPCTRNTRVDMKDAYLFLGNLRDTGFIKLASIMGDHNSFKGSNMGVADNTSGIPIYWKTNDIEPGWCRIEVLDLDNLVIKGKFGAKVLKEGGDQIANATGYFIMPIRIPGSVH